MRKITSIISRALEVAWDEYGHTADALAIHAFVEVILPYMKKHDYSFIAGNGAYYVGKYTPGRGEVLRYGSRSDWTPVDVDTLPKYIREVLEMEVPGMRGNDLGSIMPDYRPHENERKIRDE